MNKKDSVVFREGLFFLQIFWFLFATVFALAVFIVCLIKKEDSFVFILIPIIYASACVFIYLLNLFFASIILRKVEINEKGFITILRGNITYYPWQDILSIKINYEKISEGFIIAILLWLFKAHYYEINITLKTENFFKPIVVRKKHISFIQEKYDNFNVMENKLQN